jgi:hypothetical protein
MYFAPAGGEAQRHPVRDPETRFPRVLAKNHTRLRMASQQIMTQSASNQVSTFQRQRELSGHAANSIRSEELSRLISHSG